MPNFIFEMKEEKLNIELTPNAEQLREKNENKSKNSNRDHGDPVYTSQTFVIPQNFVLQLPKRFLGDDILDNPYNQQIRAKIKAAPKGWGYKNTKLLTHFESLKKAEILATITKEIEDKDTGKKITKEVTQNISYETANSLIPKKGCDLFLRSYDYVHAISDDIKIEAENKNTPILIRARGNFYIYGRLKKSERWKLSPINTFSSETTTYLENLPFNEGILLRGDILFTDQLAQLVKQGHTPPRDQIWVMLGKSDRDYDLLCVLSDPRRDKEIIQHYREGEVIMWDWSYVSPENFPIFIEYLFAALIEADLLQKAAFLDINKNPIVFLPMMLAEFTGLAVDVTNIVTNYLDENSRDEELTCKNVFIQYGFQKTVQATNEEVPVIAKSLTLWKAKESDVDVLYGMCAAGRYNPFKNKLASKDFNIETLGATLEKIVNCKTALKPKILERVTDLINQYLNENQTIKEQPEKLEIVTKQKKDILAVAKKFNLAVTVSNVLANPVEEHNVRRSISPTRN